MNEQTVRTQFANAQPDGNRASADPVQWVVESDRDGTALEHRDGDGTMLGRLLVFLVIMAVAALMLWTRA